MAKNTPPVTGQLLAIMPHRCMQWRCGFVEHKQALKPITPVSRPHMGPKRLIWMVAREVYIIHMSVYISWSPSGGWRCGKVMRGQRAGCVRNRGPTPPRARGALALLSQGQSASRGNFQFENYRSFLRYLSFKKNKPGRNLLSPYRINGKLHNDNTLLNYFSSGHASLLSYCVGEEEHPLPPL